MAALIQASGAFLVFSSGGDRGEGGGKKKGSSLHPSRLQNESKLVVKDPLRG